MTQTWGIAGMSLAMGYTLGCFNPSALIATCKKTDLREQNTGNLGTSNTMLTFGWGWGLLVLLVDVGKAVIASLLASLLFSSSSSAGLLAGGASVVGHVFPIYLKLPQIIIDPFEILNDLHTVCFLYNWSTLN